MSRLLLAYGSILVALAACATPISNPAFEALIDADGVYTLTNLHPDEQRARLYTVNYQLPNLIPVCTPVRITNYGRRYMAFEVTETGREYRYYFHKAAAEPFEDHLLRFFGGTCPDTSRLSAADRAGIEEGRAIQGMTREGVTIAMGHPPRHVNPAPETSTSWTYWRNRFGQMRVEFDSSGRVSSVR